MAYYAVCNGTIVSATQYKGKWAAAHMMNGSILNENEFKEYELNIESVS